jgi:NADH-quinone oxidoreductase subunit E
MPALYVAQRECGGWIPPEAMKDVAEVLRVPPVDVGALATFYTMFEKKPVGRYLVHVCTNISCLLCGAEDLVGYLQEKLGIGLGETTPDGKFTLLEQECLGACANAPVIQINYRFHENVTREKVDEVLAALE